MNQESKNIQKDQVNYYQQMPLENQIVEMKRKEYDYFRSFVFRLHMSIQTEWKEKGPRKQIDG